MCTSKIAKKGRRGKGRREKRRDKETKQEKRRKERTEGRKGGWKEGIERKGKNEGKHLTQFRNYSWKYEFAIKFWLWPSLSLNRVLLKGSRWKKCVKQQILKGSPDLFLKLVMSPSCERCFLIAKGKKHPYLQRWRELRGGSWLSRPG